ncbi:MAG: succinyl-CoA--3-ketoacid-CoA transferase, partial [Bacillota bacterium]|nr:succinyl-CoA--3-ketoacid-CoA transferase [Bacillota bacterium]
VVAMEHTTKNGEAKILRQCSLPLTAQGEVDIIVTDMGFIEVTSDGLVLKEIVPGLTPEEVQKATEAPLHIDQNLKLME